MHSIPRVLGVKEENECVRVRLGDVRMEVQVGVILEERQIPIQINSFINRLGEQ